MATDHILQEDGGKLVLEEGTNHLIQEESTTNVDATASGSANSRQRMYVIQQLNKRKRPRRRARR